MADQALHPANAGITILPQAEAPGAAPDRAAASAPQTDEQLMLALAAGSHDAFDSLFDRWRQPIFAFFRRRLTDPTHAEELAQETFLALLRAAPRYQPLALFRTYLYAIALKQLRAHRRRQALRVTFLGVSEPPSDPAAPGNLETVLVLRDAMRRLDATEREILMLREFEQLSYAEIAELLALPLNTVRSRLFRARSALHDLLTQPALQPSTPTAAVTPRKERA